MLDRKHLSTGKKVLIWVNEASWTKCFENSGREALYKNRSIIVFTKAGVDNINL